MVPTASTIAILFSAYRPPSSSPRWFRPNNSQFGINNPYCPKRWCRLVESTGKPLTDLVYRGWFVAESAASDAGKPVPDAPPRSQAGRSVFLSGPPQSRSRPFTPTCHASRMRKCGPTEDYMAEDTTADMDPNLRSPPRLLPPPECHIDSHAFIAAAAPPHDSETASSGVFFRAVDAATECQCSECCTSTASGWAVAPGVESSRAASCYSPNSCSSSASSSSSTRPPSSASFPSLPNWPQVEQQPTQFLQQFQSYPEPSPSYWQEWIDELVHDVRAEIRAEQQLFSSHGRKSSFGSGGTPPMCSPGPSFSFEPSSVSSSICTRATSTSNASSSPSAAGSPCGTTSSGSFARQTDSPPPSKRAKKNSLLTLSQGELAERKKQQNRAAAQRYRSRRTETLEHEREEIARLEVRNAEMRAEQRELAAEIAALRARLLAPAAAN